MQVKVNSKHSPSCTDCRHFLICLYGFYKECLRILMEKNKKEEVKSQNG